LHGHSMVMGPFSMEMEHLKHAHEVTFPKSHCHNLPSRSSWGGGCKCPLPTHTNLKRHCCKLIFFREISSLVLMDFEMELCTHNVECNTKFKELSTTCNICHRPWILPVALIFIPQVWPIPYEIIFVLLHT
jgi:hypothetical protein